MEYLPNGYTLELCPGAFPLSTDSMVLADFVRLPKHANVLDLGSGCGTLGLLLCARDPNCCVTGIEVDETAHTQALENIERNGLNSRLSSICADLRSIRFAAPEKYDVCVSNPPYFSGGPKSQRTPVARHNDLCTTQELIDCAADHLKFGGDFFLVHKPEYLADVISRAATRNLEAKRLLLLRHKENGPISLIFLQMRNGAKPGLIIEEAFLHHADGSQSEIYRKIYHI